MQIMLVKYKKKKEKEKELPKYITPKVTVLGPHRTLIIFKILTLQPPIALLFVL